MFLADWEVRIGKDCDRGLENGALGLWPRAAFSSLRSQFFTIRTDPKPANNSFFFCVNFAYKWFYPTLLLNWFTRSLQTIAKHLTRTSDNSDTRQKDVLIKEKISFELLYVSCIYFTS